MSTNDLKLLIEKMSTSPKLSFDKAEKRVKFGILNEKEKEIDTNGHVGGSNVGVKSLEGDDLSRIANRRGDLSKLSSGGRLSKLFKGN